MLICINCEIEVDEGQGKCPQCGGPLDEILDEEVEDNLDADEETASAEAAGEGGAAAAPAEAEAGAAAGGEAGASEGQKDAAKAEPGREKGRDRKAKSERKERPPRDKKAAAEKRGRKDKAPAAPEPPKPPKSIWLSQNRAPVLVATFATLFFSLYLIADFVIALLVEQNHPMNVFLGAGGLLSAIFLWGHGKLGRLGAIVLLILATAGGIFFKIQYNLENYAFLTAVVCYDLIVILTLFGKGWFLRASAGFILTIPLFAGCIVSLALDFLPIAATKKADEALDAMKQAEATVDLEKIEAARSTEPAAALAVYKDLFAYIDKVPFDKIPESLRGVAYAFMGRQRTSKLYYKPVTLMKKVYQFAPDLIPQPDVNGREMKFDGGNWVEIAEKGVEQGSVKILKPGRKPTDIDDLESPWFLEIDFEVEYGGLKGTTRLRRLVTGNVPEGQAVRVFYKYQNDQREGLLEEAMGYVRKAKDFLTGAAPDQIGPVIGALYSKPRGSKIELDARGVDMLDHFLYFDAQYVWAVSDKACMLIEEGMKNGDQAKLDEGLAKAAEVAGFYDKELFNTLGFLIQKVDPEDDPGNKAKSLLGNDEFPFVYYNNARVCWNIYIAGRKKTEADFESARQRMVQMKEIVTSNEPVKFKMQAGKILQRHESNDRPLWANRWRKAVELDDLIYAEQERIAAEKGEAPKQVKPEAMPGWSITKEDGEGAYRNSVDSYNVFGKPVKIMIEIYDADNILEGKTPPSFKDFQVRRDRMPMEIGIVEAGTAGGKIKFVFKSITAIDKEGADMPEPEFVLEDPSEAVGEEGKFINPEINYAKIEDEKLKTAETLKIIIEISRAD